MSSHGDDAVVPNDELTTADRAALGWAVVTDQPSATAIVHRVRSGDSAVTVAELAAVHHAWDAAGRPAPQHHVHRTRVVLKDGTPMFGVTFHPADPYGRQTVPAFGLYLDERWNPPWPHRRLYWPDFRVPSDVEELEEALLDLLDRARRGEIVEIGCLGGHGRTGTALACLAVLTGTPAEDAVAWVRSNYCTKAVETAEQEALVANFER